MIVYQNTVDGFLADVDDNVIDTKVKAQVRSQLNMGVSESELRSWGNSLTHVASPLRRSAIPGNAGVSIELQLPMSSKRIDFILSGYDGANKPQVVIVELKQWSEVKTTDQDGIVETFLGGGLRYTAHPSYQAWSYAEYLHNFNSTVEEKDIQLHPCAYLHNCTDDRQINDQRYSTYTAAAPVYLKTQVPDLRSYLEERIHTGDEGALMKDIDNGRIRPSKSLADSLVGLLRNQREFILLDEQKVVYEAALSSIRRTHLNRNQPKQVLIVRGGPGTGKSVVAINLLVRAIEGGHNAAYVTKNAAPRDVYESKLTGTTRTLARSRYQALFRGSGAFMDCPADQYEALIVDEAHRLNEKSGLYGNLGENQILEIINAARCSIFFLDEDQRIHLKDIGSEAEIRKWARKAGAEVKDLELPSQFRCNGEDGYLAFVDNYLGIRPTANAGTEGLDYEFKVMDNVVDLDNWVREKNEETKKARLVAGYCWEWVSKRNPGAMDFNLPGFQRQWNLTEDGNLWIMNPSSIEQVGCIHTCQGLECDYIGVIIGPDLRRDPSSGHVTTHPEKRAKHDNTVRGWKKRMKEDPVATKKQLDALIKNTYRTLMTRGMKGCAICFVD